LIPHAKAIVAINSSVGYEAILYKKPVIAMGRSFYRGQDVTIDVGSLYELEDAFERIDSFTLSDENVLKFLWRINYFSFEASNLHEKSKKNALDISNALSGYMKKPNVHY
jgi:capsule polysaccharide export protein KpsC/LpsZ